MTTPPPPHYLPAAESLDGRYRRLVARLAAKGKALSDIADGDVLEMEAAVVAIAEALGLDDALFAALDLNRDIYRELA